MPIYMLQESIEDVHQEGFIAYDTWPKSQTISKKTMSD